MDLKEIAKETYNICEMGDEEGFNDRCESHLLNSYELTDDEYDKIMFTYIEELIENDGEFL